MLLAFKRPACAAGLFLFVVAAVQWMQRIMIWVCVKSWSFVESEPGGPNLLPHLTV